MSIYRALFTGEKEDGEQSLEAVPQREPYRLLLVDDEPNVLNALKRIFRQENYKVLVANNAQEALELMADHPCEIVISDYMMPGITGGDLLYKIKELYPETIRIMLTGHADTGAVMSAIKEGAVYKFILKPWNDDDLRVTVAVALEQYELQRKNRQLQQQAAKQSRELKAMAKLSLTNRSQLAIMLHKRGLLNDQQLQEIYKLQQRRQKPVFSILMEKEWVDESKIRKILRDELMIEEVALAEVSIDPAVASLIPLSLCRQQLMIPLRLENQRLVLVMADPMDSGITQDLGFGLGVKIQPVMANVVDIEAKLAEVYEDEGIKGLETIISDVDPYDGIEVIIEEDENLDLQTLLEGTEEPPAIRLVNAIILEAIRLGASDIHIHPRTKSVVVRYRIDGVLHDKIKVPNSLLLPLVSRIKVMAELDITERRKPQDGRIAVKSPLKVVDLRISTLPTINGEKVVMRLLDRNASIRTLEQLDFSSSDLKKVLNVVSRPQGIILTTGPTGSGKTSTLYSLLQHNASSEKNYVTIEDPVEYYMDAAGQVAVRDKIGLDFASVLRAILRQDPDVILLGEIRDFETAEVAFHAALTGHLVYSTLHTNSAIATIARLFDLGLKSYVVASALQAIIAQRLVRRICQHCKEPHPHDGELLEQLGPLFLDHPPASYIGVGCNRCGQTGYAGRIGIYEVLTMDEHLRHMLSDGVTMLELNEYISKSSGSSMLRDAYSKVDQGDTTLAEILRVLGAQ